MQLDIHVRIVDLVLELNFNQPHCHLCPTRSHGGICWPMAWAWA